MFGLKNKNASKNLSRVDEYKVQLEKDRDKQISEAVNYLDKVLDTNTNNYPPVVLQIHREFNTASDKLVQKARDLLKSLVIKDESKVDRLSALGFRNTRQVVETLEAKSLRETNEAQMNLVSYYRQKYPLNKFITETQVKEICHKYNLVFGDVSLYTGFVPDKNLKEIENFKLDSSDIAYYMNSWMNSKGSVEISKEDYDSGRNSMYSHDYTYTTSKDVLRICAPIKDMNMSGKTIIDGYKILNVEIPDPVVLKPVKGGYLILTAWGDEASDPIVVNNINN